VGQAVLKVPCRFARGMVARPTQPSQGWKEEPFGWASAPKPQINHNNREHNPNKCKLAHAGQRDGIRLDCVLWEGYKNVYSEGGTGVSEIASLLHRASSFWLRLSNAAEWSHVQVDKASA
jgi:hypothetical protein